MILAHSFVGYPLTYLILKFFPEVKKLSKKQIDLLYFVGVVSAVLPDFDIVYSVLFHNYNHRYFITHSFFLYVLIFILLNLLSLKFKKFQSFVFLISLVFLGGVVSHLVLDFYVGGIVLLAPFDFRLYGYEITLVSKGFWDSYFTSFYLFYEVLAVIPFFVLISYQKIKKIPVNTLGVQFSIFFFVVSCFMSLFFIFK